MTLALGLALLRSGVAGAVLQVRWVARSTQDPIRWWRVSQPLPRGQRSASDIAIGLLIVAGAFVLEQGRPEWTFYAAAIGGAAGTLVAQVLAVRALPEPVGR